MHLLQATSFVHSNTLLLSPFSVCSPWLSTSFVTFIWTAFPILDIRQSPDTLQWSRRYLSSWKRQELSECLDPPHVRQAHLRENEHFVNVPISLCPRPASLGPGLTPFKRGNAATYSIASSAKFLFPLKGVRYLLDCGKWIMRSAFTTAVRKVLRNKGTLNSGFFSCSSSRVQMVKRTTG